MEHLSINPLMGTLEYALDGLERRTEAIADNVANANTPNYRSKKVNFERDLRAALTEGEVAPEAKPATEGGFDLTDKNGTSVRLETEMADIAKTALARQVVTSAFNYKVGLIKTATSSGA